MVSDQIPREREELQFETILDGGALEMINHTLGKVFENIVDVNTDESVREINLKLKLKPDENRSLVDIAVTVASKLAGLAKANTLADLGHVNGRPTAFKRPTRQQNLPFEPRVAAKGGV